MRTELQRVCELQRAYTPQNTPEMQERGVLIRSRIPLLMREDEARYRAALGEFGAETGIEGSDGIGRKTEAPWVRIFSPAMSPTPRSGYYMVLHFAADGSAVFITVGCGSTVWANGDLRPVSNAELKSRTEWARGVIGEAFGTLAPFTDEIALGARASLPRTFEKATAVALRIPTSEIEKASFRDLLVAAVERLAAVYRAQNVGRDIDPGEAAQAEIETIVRPTRRRSGRQGIILTAQERKAVEMRAMYLAQAWLQDEGYKVEDVSASSPFDLLAARNGAAIKVEVKGTTSDLCDSILMTRNEVELHRNEKGATALIIVSGIRLDRSATPPNASGGTPECLVGWDIGQWALEPVAFQVRRREKPEGT